MGTVKVHNIDVKKDLPYSDIDLNTFVTEALRIRTSEMRTVETCELYLSPWTHVQDEGYPHAMKEVRFADPRYKKVKL